MEPIIISCFIPIVVVLLIVAGFAFYHLFVTSKLSKEVQTLKNTLSKHMIEVVSDKQNTVPEQVDQTADSERKEKRAMSKDPFSTTVSDFNDISDVRRYVASDEGQAEVTAFSEDLIDMMNSEENYLAICQEAQDNHVSLAPEDLREIMQLFTPAFAFAGPGHDYSHTQRDVLGALALLADPFMQKAAFPAELDAGILGGLHDVGSGLIPRYRDVEFSSGHCEIGAWYVFHTLKNSIEGNKLLLTCYAINGHQHQTADKKLPNGYTRRHHTVELFFTPDDKEKEHPVGVAVLMTRYADRQENLGAGTHFPRHIVAMADAQNESGDIADFDGEKYWSMQGEALTTMFRPEIRLDWKWGMTPTLLEHALWVYGWSQFGSMPYSTHDRNFPVMRTLMDDNLGSVYRIREILFAEHDMQHFNPMAAKSDLKAILRRVSNATAFPLAWMHVARAWDALDKTVQVKWHAAVVYMNQAYEEGLASQLGYAERNQTFAQLARELYESVI